MPNSIADQERADRTKSLVGRIMTAIPDADLSTDISVIVSAIGIVAGTLATVTGRPDAFMWQLNACANGVISGELPGA